MTTTTNTSSEFKTTLLILFSSLTGFLIGNFGDLEIIFPQTQNKPIKIIPIIKFIRIEDDSLFFQSIGNSKIIFGKNVLENKEFGEIYLGQIPNKNDLELQQFSYLGNNKTNKFYPSYTYPARGTEVKHRRFFQTKQAALDAGFIASKLVK